MRRPWLGRIAVCLLLARGVASGQQPTPPPERVPAVDFELIATPYAGPGPEEPEPVGVAEVRIGYFGPADPSHADLGDAWRAANLAIEEANAEGGYNGRPFRLVAAWSPDPWTSGASHLARLTYRDGVWAIVAGFDGPSAHLAAQVAAKARIPVVCPLQSDRTAHAANVPWIVSLAADDRRQAEALVPWLAAAVAAQGDGGSYATLSTDARDARIFLAELAREASRVSPPLPSPRVQAVVPAAGGTNAADDAAVRSILGEGGPTPAAVVLGAGDAASATRLVQALRRGGFAGDIAGPSCLGLRRFASEAGSDAEGVVFPLAFEPSGGDDGFVRRFRDAAGHDPDASATLTHDAVRLVIDSIRHAGLNRARIGEALRQGSAGGLASGPATFDGFGLRRGRAQMGTIRDGRPVVVRIDP
jgi:branched-chain amino acid transport system substrate-binding protein